jgi:ribosomal protein S14
MCDDVQICNCCVRELLILARAWFASGLPSKTWCDNHTEEETKDYEPCTTVFNPRITKHCDLRGEGVEKEVACGLEEGVLSGVFCFALSRMKLRELVGEFIGD